MIILQVKLKVDSGWEDVYKTVHIEDLERLFFWISQYGDCDDIYKSRIVQVIGYTDFYSPESITQVAVDREIRNEMLKLKEKEK